MERLEILEFDIDNEENDIDSEIKETSEEELKQRYKITSLDSCNWAFRKLATIKVQEEEINELAKNEIERINAWKEDELKKTEDSKAFFEGLLTEYFIEQKQVDPKFKISTPHGKVTSRKQQPKYEYDVEKFIAWAEANEHAELVRIKKEVDKTATKKTFEINGNQLVDEETGLIVDGVTVLKREDSINIKVE